MRLGSRLVSPTVIVVALIAGGSVAYASRSRSDELATPLPSVAGGGDVTNDEIDTCFWSLQSTVCTTDPCAVSAGCGLISRPISGACTIGYSGSSPKLFRKEILGDNGIDYDNPFTGLPWHWFSLIIEYFGVYVYCEYRDVDIDEGGFPPDYGDTVYAMALCCGD